MTRRIVILIVTLAAAGLIAFGVRASLDRAGGPRSVTAVPDPDLAGAEPRVAKTIRDAREWVHKLPNSKDHWGRLAMVLHIHGFEPEAIPAYRQTAALDPDEFKWPYFEAIAAREVGTSGVIEAFDRAARIRDDYAPFYLRRGQALYDDGRLDEAGVAFERALELGTEQVAAHVGLARIALAREELESGRDHLLAAIEVYPEYATAHGLLAEAYRRLGDEGAAELERFRAGRADPPVTDDPLYLELIRWGQSARWYQLRAQALLNAGQPAAAEEQLRVALEARPDDSNLHNDLGRALQRQGKLDDAAAEHRIAIELRPDFKEAMVNLAGVLFLAGEFEAAVREAGRAVETDSTFAAGWRTLGILYAARGRSDLAIAAFQNGLARGVFDSETAARLAWLLATASQDGLRDGAAAVQLAEVVARLGEFRVPEELDLLAAAYAEAGRMEEALVFALQAEQYAVEDGQTELVPGIRARRESYQAGRPWRE